jgi:hypothetical protein
MSENRQVGQAAANGVISDGEIQPPPWKFIPGEVYGIPPPNAV